MGMKGPNQPFSMMTSKLGVRETKKIFRPERREDNDLNKQV